MLLDTHTVLWALLEPDKLGAVGRGLIAARSTEILVSAASAWEIGTKFRLGRLPAADHLVHNYPAHLERLGATPLPITDAHTLHAGTLAWDHRDPFDRMLATQSVLENVPLVTQDRAFSTLPIVRAIW